MRRLQTLAATAWIVTFVCGGFFFSLMLLYAVFYTSYWWAVLLYVLWIFADRDAPMRGGVRWGNGRVEWVRHWTWWSLYRDFFPLRLERLSELPPDQNYLFACYPHGVLCSGVFGHFCVHSPDFERLFPGISATMHTLDQNFNQPVIRDLICCLGMAGSSRQSLMNVLSTKGGGCASVLVVGGAAEALKSRPGTYNIILKPRKVFSFGETELYDQLDNPEGSRLRCLQEKLRKIIGIAPVIFLGRGIFQYSFGMVPHRRPVTVLVGNPIDVPLIPCPTFDEVNELHAKYTSALVQMFNEHKHRLLKNPNVELKID
ncbi:hypothetical protein B566_EDAN007442 [Ephemera danica]|nr:hypothetical protein B566_EDAN007442 [Ephemera danica]